jgi:hypothetical protein
MEGRGTRKLGKAIENMTEDYIKDLNLGFAEYEVELSIQSYGSTVPPPHEILSESVTQFRRYKMRKYSSRKIY